MIPGFFDGFSAIDTDMKHLNRRAGHARQQHRADLGDIARPSRSVNGKTCITPLAKSPRHHLQATQASARGAALRRAKSEALDHFARPLAVKGGGVHDHDAAVSAIPGDGQNHAVPERPDAWMIVRRKPVHSRAPEDLKSQRGTEHTNKGVNDGGNDGNLDAAAPGQVGQARIIVRADGRFLRLALDVWSFHFPIVYRDSESLRLGWRPGK